VLPLRRQHCGYDEVDCCVRYQTGYTDASALPHTVGDSHSAHGHPPDQLAKVGGSPNLRRVRASLSHQYDTSHLLTEFFWVPSCQSRSLHRSAFEHDRIFDMLVHMFTITPL
jgi:hypothetical protein